MVFRIFIISILILIFITSIARAGEAFYTDCDPARPVSFVDNTSSETGEPEEEESPWDYSFRTSLSGSNSTYRNWSQGGVDNIAVLGSTGFSASFKKENLTYNQSINLRYGQTRIGDGDFVKSDDLIRMRSRFGRQFRDERLSTILNINFETQFAKGYDKLTTDDDEPRIMISRFFAPAYATQVLGLGYNPERNLRFEAGLAMKQTIVSDTTLSTRYGLDTGTTFRNEAGFSVVIGFERRIMESIYYSGQIDTFTNVNKRLTSTDVMFVSEITGQINRYISANIEFALAYNDDITDELQVKQILSLGFNYNFFDD